MRFPPAHTLTAHAGWRARALACWLALLVVLAPTLGRMHGVLHLPPSALLLAPHLAADTSGTAEAASGKLLSLFQHHAVLDCWELEQLGHGHDLQPFVWQGAAPAPEAIPAWHPSPAASAAVPRPFHARAPPAGCMV